MRSLGFVIFALAGAAFGQSMMEVGVAAAGGAAGGAAGKKVSEGISTIFGQVDQLAKEASKDKSLKKEKAAPGSAAAGSAAAPATAVGPATGAPMSLSSLPATGIGEAPTPARTAASQRPTRTAAPRPERDSVPAPPAPPGRRAVAVVAKAEQQEPPPIVQPSFPVLPPPPPPTVATAQDLKTVSLGTNRTELLKLGAPASKITMIDNGHLLEIYHYASKDSTLGVVRLNDGAVASVEVR